jgi:2-methylcitrate dehydratase PrpD
MRGMSDALSVSERLVAFMREWQTRGVPGFAMHETTRLLINQLKASVGAVDNKTVQILHKWAVPGDGGTGEAQVLWFGTRTSAEHAAVVNGALFEVLDFNDTYIPCFMHAVSGVLPAVLAEAEVGGQSGHDVVTALALGIEAELAVATILMPTGYFRGFIPGGITGAIGGAAACGLLLGLTDKQLCDAIGLAMNSGCGTYQSAGFMTLPTIMGMVARTGLTASRLAALGLEAPRLAFEGDKGMFSAYSDEPREKFEAVLGSLGETWRMLGNTYKTVPTETITHGPIECVLAILARAQGRTVERMRFGVEAIVVKIANERAERWGTPGSDLEARFDMRFCAAATWIRGRFTLEEMREAAYTDPAILALRDRIELMPDATHKTFDGASLEVSFTDGSSESVVIPAFRGTPENRMSDDELSQLFRLSCGDLLPAGRPDAILQSAWGLRSAPDVRGLMSLLRCH